MSVSYPYFSLAKDHQQYGLILKYVDWLEGGRSSFDRSKEYARISVELRCEIWDAYSRETERRRQVRTITQVNFPLIDMWSTG